jgi:hypothetical protein
MGLRRRLFARRSRRARATTREPVGDRLTRVVRGIFAVLGEVLKLAREMLVIPAQLWLFAAETAGAWVLAVWRRGVLPLLRTAWALLLGLYELAARHLSPARAVGAVAAAALVALAAGQWLDLSSITIGNDLYSPGVETVAPAPEVTTERAGDAHAWVMLPIALAGFTLLVAAFRGRPRLARLLGLVGVAVIVIALAVDAPQGLDEGTAAIAYEGAEAQLIEGFWLQIVCGAVLIAAGLMLPRYLRAEVHPAPAARSRRSAAPGWTLPTPKGSQG